jgi:ABC-type transport system involved in multi-copper enzyme maturation permease subunit
MLWAICRFELRYQLRRYWTWLGFVAVSGIVYLTADGAPVDDATYASTFINSSFTVAMNTVIGCLVWLLVAAPVAGEAAARDASTRMHPLTYTTPVRKRDYLGGRFLAAFLLNAAILLGVTLGVLLAAYRPGVPGQYVGPLRAAAFLYPYLFVALPNVFLATSVQFAAAALGRRPMAAYLGSVLVFFVAYVVGLIVAFALRDPELSKLLDPIGPFFIFGELPAGWTPVEKNTRLLTLEGGLLHNRLIWTGVGVGTLALTYARFRFAHHVAGGAWRRLLRRRAGTVPSTPRPAPATPVASRRPAQPAARSFDVAAGLRQTVGIAGVSFRTLVRMRGGLDVLLFIAALVAVVQPLSLEVAGVPIVARTERVLRDLTTPLTNFATPFALVALLVVYWAGELVWRERDAGLGEITDAAPVRHWAMFLGKLLGLALMLAAFMALLALAGVLVQLRVGATDVEVGRYLQILFGFQLTEYLLFAVLAFVVHVLANQKYLGHLVAVVLYGLIALSPLLGLEHRLLVYGASPPWSYTQMRGFGPSVGPWVWFKLYWAAWALLLAVGGLLLWARGREGGPRARLRAAGARLTPPVTALAASAAALVLGVGGYVFYNTNVRHRYVTRYEDAEIRAAYERRYARTQRVPQPRVAATRVRVELHPERRVAEVRGTYVMVNRDTAPIDTLYLAPSPAVRTTGVTFDRSARLVVADSAHLTHVYALARPLLPGDTLRLDFALRHAPRGFMNGGMSTAVLHNGTQIKLVDWLPGIGYQPLRELLKPRDRTDHGLPTRPVFPVVEDEAARYHIGQRTMFETVVGTSAGQTAVAPGALVRSWSEGGRRYFHYRTDAPIGGELPILSAVYALHREIVRPAGGGRPVEIRVHYDPRHRDIVDNVVRGARATLEYGTKHFGPYPYGHVTISERSAGGMGLNAESGNIDYSEQFAMLAPERNPNTFDFTVAVLGHEMGHNFGPPIAAVEGAPVVSESFAWYVAMGVMGHAYGREHLARLVGWMHEPYPHRPVRQGVPLMRGLDPWTGYRRGPFALFALREFVGADRVNAAIRRWRELHFAPGAPPATTLTLHRELQRVTPDSLQYLLRDLFERNTFWALGVAGTAKPARGGSWEVTLQVKARKVVVDSAGRETEVPMDDLVDLGVYASPNVRLPTDPLYLRRQRIRSGRQTITLTVPRKPARVGLDPHLLLLDLDANDNWEAIRIEP